MPKYPVILCLIFSLLLSSSLTSCEKKLSPQLLLSQAEEKLIKICQEEYNLKLSLKALPNTLWIYLPLEGNLLSFKAAQLPPQNSTTAVESLSIKFLDGKFKDGLFSLKYDIGISKSYPQDPGYTTEYSEEYQTAYSNILTALYQIFPEGINSEEKVPDLFVIVFADIKNGLKSQITFYFKDFLRSMTDHSFQEESLKRFITDPVTGDFKLIEDKEGQYLEYQEITWPEFLVKQIVHRIQYKYTQSSFPPSMDTKNEILKIFKETFDTYQFKDFTSIQLHDFNKNTIETIEPSALNQIEPP